MMYSSRSTRFLYWSFLAVTCTAISAAFAAGPGKRFASGVILLRNQRILTGRVATIDDRYEIQLDGGGTARVPKEDVQFVGRNMDHVFRYRRSQSDQNDVIQILHLAHWCISHDLYRQAAHCVLRATELAPRHPGIAQVDARLRQAIQVSRGNMKAAPVPRVQRRNPKTIQVSHVSDSFSNSDLGDFKRSIQPLLLNRCTTSGCHRSRAANGYGLLLPSSRSRSTSRRVTIQNLRSTLAWIDHGEPDESRLLKAAAAPHGPRRKRTSQLLTIEQLERLRRWVANVTDTQGQKPETDVLANRTRLGLIQPETPRGHLHKDTAAKRFSDRIHRERGLMKAKPSPLKSASFRSDSNRKTVRKLPPISQPQR